MHRFDRALGLLLLLRDGEQRSAALLARHFEVSIRTIYRDLDTLSQLGIPLVTEPGRTGGVRLQPGYFLPPIMFSEGEAISLLLGAAMFRSLRTRPFAAELESGETKLIAAMPTRIQASVARTRALIGFEQDAPDAFHAADPRDELTARPDPAHEGSVIEIFLRALLDQRTVSFRYRSPYRSDETRYAVSPLGIIADRTLWYLVGHPYRESARPRLWRADRVLAIDEGTRPAHPDPAFDVRALLGRAWLDRAMADWQQESPVVIRMNEEQANRIRQDWYYRHAAFTAVGDGRVEMALGQDDQNVVFELVRWLGPGAELIEPSAWRSDLSANLVALAAAHTD